MNIRITPTNSARYGAIFQDGPEKNILVIMMGGTIDSKPYMNIPAYKKYKEPPDFIAPLPVSMIPKQLIRQNDDEACYCIQMEMKDSQNINDLDIEKVARQIKEAHQKKVAVSCGTTDLHRVAHEMLNTLQRLGVIDKVVIIYGAMDPLAHGARGDGFKNIDNNMKVLRYSTDLLPGVYVGMPDEKGEHRIFAVDEHLRKVTLPNGTGGNDRYFAGTVVDIKVPPRPLFARL